MPPLFLAALPLISLFFVETASAACSRADVDHFLSRGFSHEQVVLLCGGRDGEPETALVQETTETERELRELLLRSVDAERVEVDSHALRWRSKLCASYAPDNLAGRPRERCGMVTQSVSREAIEIGDVRKKVLIFGDNGIEIGGPIQQQWDINTEGLSKADQNRLAENTGSELAATLLPLHSSADPEDVAQALRRWRDAREIPAKP